MENTKTNQAKFNALYWEQKVGCSKYSKNFTVNKSNFGSIEYLQLKSLQSISDEDCVELFDLIMVGSQHYIDVDKIHYIKELLNHNKDYSPFDFRTFEIIVSFLRSKEYLAPYNTLTPDQIIEYGWAKIE